ncbi:hypothetical protein DGM85_18860 [Xanthomonas phaseoli pv. phaseoli]|nr:hypothetical protein DGM85_18860 [Xanthomonas phaseoli pv. phaseoli]QWN31969.1 hypothetical protein DGM81_03875 [Xanthomonas phaseoli pv. phaseoli]
MLTAIDGIVVTETHVAEIEVADEAELFGQTMFDVDVELVLTAAAIAVELLAVAECRAMVAVVEPATAIAMQRLDDHQGVALRLGPRTGQCGARQRGKHTTQGKRRCQDRQRTRMGWTGMTQRGNRTGLQRGSARPTYPPLRVVLKRHCTIPDGGPGRDRKLGLITLRGETYHSCGRRPITDLSQI